MSTHGLDEPMEHDGDPNQSSPSSTALNPESTIADHQGLAGDVRSTDIPNPPVASNRRDGRNNVPERRLFCPVIGCPQAYTSSNRGYTNFQSIKKTLK